jgi:hypothetical protein
VSSNKQDDNKERDSGQRGRRRWLQAAMAAGDLATVNLLTQKMVDEARAVAPKSKDKEGKL